MASSPSVEDCFRRKVAAQSIYDDLRHELLFSLDEDVPCEKQVLRQLSAQFSDAKRDYTAVLLALSEKYDSCGESQKLEHLNVEVDFVREDYYSVMKEVRSFLTNTPQLSRVNSEHDLNDTIVRREGPPSSEAILNQCRTLENDLQKEHVKVEKEFSDLKCQLEQQVKQVRTPDDVNPTDRTVSSGASPKKSTTPDRSATLGVDMWKQLKRVSIPVFSGDTRTYESWKASFVACIDQAPATPEYKLLQLRQHLEGDALRVIESLGHSATAYETAKERLDRKFGGRRRQVALYLEELANFPPMRSSNNKDIERFADLLDIAVVNLKEAGRTDELKDGSLYKQLQSKMPKDMGAQYHRWVFEQRKSESVMTLREWILLESDFLTIAAEAVDGVYNVSQRSRPNRTFFGESSKQHSKGQKFNRRFVKKCKVCNGSHNTWQCDKFRRYTIRGRWETAKRLSLCFRCLADDHRGVACPKSIVCGVDGCTKYHNRLLHERRSESPKRNEHTHNRAESNVPHIPEERSHTTQAENRGGQSHFTALRTVPVVIRNGNRRLQVNALLDDGSTRSYINSDVAAELGLQAQTKKVTVNVLNGKCDTFETMPVDFTIESTDGYIKKTMNALTTQNVTGNLKVVDWQKYAQNWTHLRGINFPTFKNRPTVDILLGIDCADLHYSKRDVRGRPGEPVARLTPLGWTCVGPAYHCDSSEINSNYASTFFVKNEIDETSIDHLLRKFWEVEEVCSTDEMRLVNPAEKKAMQTAETTMTYDHGRYKVGIPWKEGKPSLPDSYEMAFKRLQNTEKRLNRQQSVATEYSAVLDSYKQKGYIEKVATDDTETAWYLPHFPVVRPDKATTKTRIVFDAAAKTHGICLNDTIHKGPKLQRELFDVLQRFRRYPVALVCDIAEMYLQIGLIPEDRKYHRFLWRDLNQDKQPDIYQFNRVVFGVNSSPFQAQFVCQQHARSFQDSLPLAAETINKSTYMDDSLDSMPTENEGIDLYLQLAALWGKAGMHARKWLSNSPAVLKQIPIQDRASEVKLDSGTLPTTKSLGVLWQTEKDVLTFEAEGVQTDFRYTKRNFLKKIATLFDPLGLVSPFTVLAKLLLQDMWQAGIDWDEPLDEALTRSARNWFAELPKLVNVRVPRSLQLQKRVISSSYHTFVDASEKAYGAVMYARHVYDGGEITTRMIASKTRVAPLTSVSIPRLELMAAVAGLRLAQAVTRALEVDMQKVVFWSDSMNVLWWIRGRSRSFKPFVANRVGEIQSVTSPEQWRHVPTNDNPADLLTRGLMASELVNETRWWSGPDYLQTSEFAWPKTSIEPQDDTSEKKSATKSHAVTTLMTSAVFEPEFRLQPTRFSSWKRLVRLYAWVNRFIGNCRASKCQRVGGELTSDELCDVENQIIEMAQRDTFPEEVKAAKQKSEVPRGSKIIGLNPKMDENGVLRCDGRLTHAEFLPFDVRYPVILPRQHWVTKLIVKLYHENSNHAGGTNHTLSAISERFWIVSGREAIREYEGECAECRRRKARAAKQIMAPLPPIRFKSPLRAFSRTAVDFAGPFVTIQGRGQRRQKRYLCLFTCLCSRAVHLEVAYGLDTDSFMNALYRMVNRRGLADEILSDNGTNFKAADKELKALVSQLDNDKIGRSAANRGIKWIFNPPLAPHFGGAHETMVKAAKKAISAILGNADITDEELTTAFTGAESLLNSRPLTYQSASPNDDVPLTPNHFLHGQCGGQFAPESVDTTSFNLLRRWRRVQELVRHFWQRWLREWLPGLNARKKWFRTQRDLQAGDVVLVISPDTARGKWPLGRILEVYTGRDGHVRTAKVQTGKTSLVRPISKLCPLELDTIADGQ